MLFIRGFHLSLTLHFINDYFINLWYMEHVLRLRGRNKLQVKSVMPQWVDKIYQFWTKLQINSSSPQHIQSINSHLVSHLFLSSFSIFVFCFEFTHNSGMNVCLVCFDACWWFQSPGLLNGATFDPITECIISHYILDKFQVLWFRTQMPNDFTAWYLLLWCHSVISVDSSKLLCNIWGILTSCGIVGFDKVGKTAYCNP